MNPVTIYNDLLDLLQMKWRMNEDNKKSVIKNAILGIVLTRSSIETGRKILESIEYFHYRSGKQINFYFPGYGSPIGHDSFHESSIFVSDKRFLNHASRNQDIEDAIGFGKWSFSPKLLAEFIGSLEDKTSWKYSGESELILLEFNGKEFNFKNAIILNLDALIRANSTLTIDRLFENLFHQLRNIDDINLFSDRAGATVFMERIFSNIISKRVSDIWRNTVPYAVQDIRKN